MTNNENVIRFARIVREAKICDVGPQDILNDRDLAIADLCWRDISMQVENEAKLIKHERALEKFGKKAA